jgi:hypothetical protein
MSATFRMLGATLLPLALVLAACAGSPPAATGPGATNTTQPGATDQPTDQPTEPAGATATTPVGGGPTFPDGAWTAGTAHVVISGDYAATLDLPLQPGSMSAGGSTVLQYVQAEPFTSFTISVESGSVSVVVTTTTYVGGGGTTEDAPCSASWARAEPNSVEGAVTCQNAPVVATGSVTQQHINIQATFTATR